MALSYAQKQMAKRRSGDINRLTSDYQQAVSQYTSKVGEKEKVFQGEMDVYNQLFGAYEAKSTAYQKRLLDYMDKMKAYQAKPMESYFAGKGGYQYVPRIGAYMSTETIKYGGSQYGPAQVSGPFVGSYVDSGSGKGQTAFRLAPGYSFSGGTIYGKTGDPGAFTEKFEEPAPTAPKLMDISAEKAALQSEKDYTDREIAERSKARLRAVGRGAQRGMLSAGTNISTQA
jgi:hypothetical protein